MHWPMIHLLSVLKMLQCIFVLICSVVCTLLFLLIILITYCYGDMIVRLCCQAVRTWHCHNKRTIVQCVTVWFPPQVMCLWWESYLVFPCQMDTCSGNFPPHHLGIYWFFKYRNMHKNYRLIILNILTSFDNFPNCGGDLNKQNHKLKIKQLLFY